MLELDEQVREISKAIYVEKSILIMGRGYNFATCLEGALKIKVHPLADFGKSSPIKLLSFHMNVRDCELHVLIN